MIASKLSAFVSLLGIDYIKDFFINLHVDCHFPYVKKCNHKWYQNKKNDLGKVQTELHTT